MKKVLLLVFPLMLSGCIDDVARVGLAVHNANEERNDNPEKYMSYFKDKKTGLCFASLDMPNITNVPCSPEVLKVIDEKEALLLNKNKKTVPENQSEQKLQGSVEKSTQ